MTTETRVARVIPACLRVSYYLYSLIDAHDVLCISIYVTAQGIVPLCLSVLLDTGCTSFLSVLKHTGQMLCVFAVWM